MIVSHSGEQVTAVDVDEASAEILADALDAMRGYHSHGVTVLNIRTEIRHHIDDSPFVDVMLVLTPPPEGEVVWSREAMRDIRDEARARAAEVGFNGFTAMINMRDTDIRPTGHQAAGGTT